MKTISYKLKDLDQKEKKVTLKLGYVGENEHVQIRIDCSEIWENYPNAVASLAVEPPEGSKYPAIVTREGNVVCWTVKDSDVVHDGDGRIQLTFTEGSEIQKTVICRTKVDESIIGSGTAPDPIADFVSEANEALAELEAAEVHGPVIGEDGYWYTWSKDAGEYVKTDTKAQGEDGQQGPAGKDGADGAPGQDGHTPVKGTDYWTQQDQADIVAAAALETVSAVIDDTAGDGDTDKTWSADKISETTGQLLTAIHGTDNHIAGIEYGGKILSKNVKNALLNLFTHVAYTDGNAQQYIDDLKSAWGITATISAINAVFTQGGAVIMEGDDIDTLKAYLVVNGVYTIDEYSFEDEVTGYTLSGTLSEGESIITVTYNGMTTTFTVEVTPTLPSAYKKVEWIGTTGTQAIMFPSIIATTTAELEKYEFDIDFKFDQWRSNAATNIVAAFSSYGGSWIGYNNNVGNIAMGTSSGMYFTDNQPTVRHQYHYSFENGAGKFERDDHSSVTRAFSSPSYGAVFALFCSTVKYEGGSTYFNDEFKFIGKLYGLTMTYEGEPLLELIPCYRKSDNVIGLYDMVGGTFYINNGTGTFTKGDDV